MPAVCGPGDLLVTVEAAVPTGLRFSDEHREVIEASSATLSDGNELRDERWGHRDAGQRDVLGSLREKGD